MYSVMKPPTAGPVIGATMTIMPKIDMLIACLLGGLMSNMMVMVIGPMKAAEMPWTMRNTIIALRVGAAPQAAEETRNSSTEYMNRLREPT